MRKFIALSIVILGVLVGLYVFTPHQLLWSPTKRAISLAGSYLQDNLEDSGQFVYRVNIDPTVKMKRKYNILRHFGAVYALNSLRQYDPSSVDPKKIQSALNFIIRASFRPIDETKMGVWTTEKLSGRANIQPQIKLGAAGLGLVALTGAWDLIKEDYPLADLEALGEFVLWMQKSDGGFYSKYKKDKGKDDNWTSLYYPGEAAFGLVELFKVSEKKKYFDGAVRALIFLVEQRRTQHFSKIPADHWAMIATAKVFEQGHLIDQNQRTGLTYHMEQLVRKVISDQVQEHKNVEFIGGFDNYGRVTPAATRLEGLIAVYPWINDVKLKSLAQATIESGIDFLRRAQIKGGKFQGAWPRAVSQIPGNSRIIKQFNRRSGEIRIDYVQHALSALLEYQHIKGTFTK